jgi:hypothetical protein
MTQAGKNRLILAAVILGGIAFDFITRVLINF